MKIITICLLMIFVGTYILFGIEGIAGALVGLGALGLFMFPLIDEYLQF
jgi:hypothetical protein